jgi:hypothetical protein
MLLSLVTKRRPPPRAAPSGHGHGGGVRWCSRHCISSHLRRGLVAFSFPTDIGNLSPRCRPRQTAFTLILCLPSSTGLRFPEPLCGGNQGVVTFTLMVLLCSCSVMLSRSCTSPAHKAKKQSLRLYFGYVTAAYGLLNTVVSLKIHGTILNRA